MITLLLKSKKKAILRITLIVISAIIIISGVTVYLFIESSLSKINLKGDAQLAPIDQETEVYYNSSNNSIDWNAYDEPSTENKVTKESTIKENIEGKDISALNPNTIVEEHMPMETGQAEKVFEYQSDTGYTTEEKAIVVLNSLIENNMEAQTKLLAQENITNLLFIVNNSDNYETSKSSDDMILLTINQEDEIIYSTTFSKQIYLQIPGKKNNTLYTAYLLGGEALIMQTIEKNFNIKIERYITTDYNSFQLILKTIGDTKLNLEKMNQTLNGILPKITTNLTENEILSFVLMMPNYICYEQLNCYIPLDGSYESYQVRGVEVLGIDFVRNVAELHARLTKKVSK